MNESDTAPSERNEPRSRSGPLGGRPAILFIAVIFGIISGTSVVGFLYNLTINYSGTDHPVIAVDPLWMVGHVIRALALGVLTYQMWRYQAAMKHWQGPDSRNTEEFTRAHATLWKTGALVLGTLLTYSIIYVMLNIVARR